MAFSIRSNLLHPLREITLKLVYIFHINIRNINTAHKIASKRITDTSIIASYLINRNDNVIRSRSTNKNKNKINPDIPKHKTDNITESRKINRSKAKTK